ncbi:MAG: hypothetical protein H0X67_09245 [Acidobacteria bacterium]|nr:hypothetical protein [Acidobacteriota bacterium]
MNIAYQVVGSGPVDLVFVIGLVFTDRGLRVRDAARELLLLSVSVVPPA